MAVCGLPIPRLERGEGIHMDAAWRAHLLTYLLHSYQLSVTEVEYI